MGQKVNPIGLRLGIIRDWDSRWFETKNYAKFLIEDIQIRNFIKKHYAKAGIARVIIERPAKKPVVNIHSARPGVLIGKKGADIDVLKKKLSTLVGSDVSLNIIEVRKADIDANLVAQAIAQQITGRVSYRRAMKKAMQNTMRAGAEGIRVLVSGRLAGAEIARDEQYREGRVPLHTLRADVDYGTAESLTTYGIIGVKVWIFRGEVGVNTDAGHFEVAATTVPSATIA
jgi:small subunit ribosomal protein S3